MVNLLLAGMFLLPPTLWAAPRKPRVRAITAFVQLDREHYAAQVEDALHMLRRAKAAFEQAGYEVQTVRITTQPFPAYTHGLSKEDALAFFRQLDNLAQKESFLLNLGTVSDPDDSVLLREILATTRLNASLTVAGEDGVHWNAVRSAAQVIKYLEEHSPNGIHNFDFAAIALVPEYTPFYPGAHHEGEGHRFSVGLEGGNFAADVFAAANGDLPAAKAQLTRAFAQQARTLETVALQVEHDSGWRYMGLDATPAPGADSSIGAALETLIGARFGSSGTLTAASVVTEAVRAIPVKRAGYSGLMLPVLEDPVLARRWGEGTYGIDALLAYSAVCGAGLDVVPLPGDISEEQLARIIGDVASLAVKWHKPLSARLVPAPGKKAGDRTTFDFGVADFPNTTLQPLP